ncbi:polysaccharide deacetylase family protein [Natronorubrum sulfidifaciens]|uniref:Polysaccharide deacetylase n=1 Tax=Natronorubrum sulfidifaciens JCM 14089 TaxID=1230460 RepID=L9W5C7_9EURY|nr:hypothetical protein [Natronorubrum sulfidifaciens]ELY44547.1 hypothetical protein C495_11619 [Natronorubrum sulfidifaciens JCM 14089]
MTNRNRRSFVTTVATAGTLGLAGCLSTISEWRGSDDGPIAQQPSDRTGDDPERLGLPGESIDRFEDLEQWRSMIDAGSLEAATDEPYTGSQSARLTADDETEYAAIYTTTGGIDLREQNLSLAVNFTSREQLHLSLELFAPNAQHAYTMARTLTGPTDRWVRVDFGTSRVDGQPDLADVREIRLTARRRGDHTGPIACRVDDLRAVDRPETGSVMLLFDGTLESHYTTAFERMEQYGYAGVEAVIPEAVGDTRDGRLTLDALSELDDAGWDMAARPRTGANFIHEYSPEQQADLIERTKASLERWGFDAGAKHFITPRNVLGPETIDLVREYHEQAFRYGGGPNGLALTDPHNVGVFSGAAGSETYTYIDHAAAYGQLAVLHFEEIGNDGFDEQAFAALLEYLDEQEINVVTATDLLEGA